MQRSPAPSEPRIVRAYRTFREKAESVGFVRAADVICAMALSYVVIAAVLRVIWLFRPDPFGNSFLQHPQRFIFQAIAFDAMQVGWLVVPSLLILLGFALARGGKPIPRRAEAGARALFCVVITAVIIVTVFDQEFMRFMGIHVSLAQLDTYGNSAAMKQVPRLIAEDSGGPFLGFAILPAAVIGSFLWMRAIRRKTKRKPWRASFVLLAAVVASYSLIHFVHHSWIYHWRLATPLDLARLEWKMRTRPQLKAADVIRFADGHHTRWWRMNGQTMMAGAGAPEPPAESLHRFPWLGFPLLHVTMHQQCELTAAGHPPDLAPLDCTRDDDRDGVPLALDCDDRDAAVHPGMVDVPQNGIDEDCSGADVDPPNILLLVLESHRAMNVGHLQGSRLQPPVTPELDKLADEGVAFARASANGLPTIASFMAIHTSLLPHPDVVVGATFTMDAMHSLPEALRQHGYYARFFSSVDPSYDNQTIWLEKWYDATDFSPKRTKDAPLFEHMSSWFKDEWPKHQNGKDGKRRPFFVTAMTATNHYPFTIIEGVDPPAKGGLTERMQSTMRYVDRAMGKLIAELKQEPWWGNTVVIITGDHGFPLGEHGSYRITETAHAEATSVPLVILGGHPEVKRIKAGLRSEPVSHLDLAPTILDLVGVDLSGSWMGRSLVAPGEGQVLLIASLGWSNERREHRALIDPRSYPKGGLELFDRVADFSEQNALPLEGQVGEGARALAAEVAEAAALMRYLYEKDRLWPKWLTN